MPTRFSEILEPGKVYTRSELAERFAIVDATINTGIFKPKGSTSIWLFVTETKTRDRVQYVDQLDGDSLHWQGQTSGRKDSQITDHARNSDELLLFYRKAKYEHPHGGFVYEGPFRYVSHQGEKPASFLLKRDTQGRAEAVEADADRLVLGRRQGFASSSAVRKVVEEHAMKAACAHFRGEGWSVEDVSNRQSFDLLCTKGTEELRVEVKGTTTGGEAVLLTRNEVIHAREMTPKVALFVLHGIELAWEGDAPVVSGGTPRVIQPWEIDTGVLTPLSYEYRLPAI